MIEPERCAECGFDGEHLMVGDAITVLRSMGRRWRELFEDVPDERLRERPSPEIWSALEYAAHTRDVIAVIWWGVDRFLKGDEPAFEGVEPDEPGADHGYNALDPADVLSQLAANAEGMADRAERTLSEHWKRRGTVGETPTDTGWMLGHAVHDATHHIRDVERGLGA